MQAANETEQDAEPAGLCRVRWAAGPTGHCSNILARPRRLGSLARLFLWSNFVISMACVLPAGSEEASAVSDTSQELPTRGPLRVSSSNSRYFADRDGRIVVLAGSHTWNNFQDIGAVGARGAFAYDRYLDDLKARRHNFIRLWVWEHAQGLLGASNAALRVEPLPYLRTGPGVANDGRPKFDLDRFNPDYFRRLHERVAAAGRRGIYVSVMLFNGWSVTRKPDVSGPNPWSTHPFHRANNINGIDADVDRNENGDEFHQLGDRRITAYQEAYVRRVIDELDDLDNVLYEISNESESGSTEWQYHVVGLVTSYGRTKGNERPVGMTVAYPDGSNSALVSGPAHWISPRGNIEEPDIVDGIKVVVADTDHLCGICGDVQWVWKAFTSGQNPIFMDVYSEAAGAELSPPVDVNDVRWREVREGLGQVVKLSEAVDMANLVPAKELASSGYALATPTRTQLVAYTPERDVNLDLSGIDDTFTGEWLHPVTGEHAAVEVVVGGENVHFTSPFGRGGVLVLRRVPHAGGQ